MDLSFLKNLFGSSEEQNPNQEIDDIKSQIQKNKNSIQAPWEMKANDALLKQDLANAQPYPLAPLDMKGDQFGALKGVLPDENTTFKGDVQYTNSPMDPNPEMPNLLASMLSPAGIQRPLFNYNQSPEENAALGTGMSNPNLAAPQQKPITMRSLASTNPKSAVRNPASNPQASVPQPAQMPDVSSEAQLAPQPEEPAKDPMMEMLEKAQEHKRQQNFLANMLDAGDRIGTAIAGQGHLKYEGGKFDNIRKAGDQGVEDVIQKQKFKGEQQDQELKGYNVQKAKQQMMDDKAKSDPNSDVSKMTRASVLDSLSRIGRKDLAAQIKPNMSSKQIEDIFGQYNLQNMVTAYEAQQNRLEMAKIRADEKATAKKDKSDKAKDDFITQRYDKIVQGGAYKSMSKMAQAKRLIDQAVRNPSGIQDVGALYSLIKMFDPESVVREGELKLTDSARSMYGRANTLISKTGSNPRVLDKKTLQEIQKAANAIYSEAQQQYKMQVKPVLDQAKKRGIEESDYSMIDPLYEEMKNLGTPMQQSAPQIDYNSLDFNKIDAEIAKRGSK